MKVMLVISYDGSKFNGFQRQNNVRSIQGEVEKELSKIYNTEIIIKGSGRTDALVHAKGQVIHFECPRLIPNLKKIMNKELKDITIHKVKVVDDNFHARHSVKTKTYLYKLDTKGNKNSNYYGVCKSKLNLKNMQKASKLFLGHHDFRNFVGGFKDNYETTITNIKIYKFNGVIYFKFTGYAFYRYMVRNLVGALIHLGKGKINEEVIKAMLDTKDFTKRLPTASPSGLYLMKVTY